MEALTSRRVKRVRHELKRRDLQVLRTEALGTGFVRVTFGGDDLADFVSLGFDDHVKLLFGPDVRRDYTPRRFDPAPRELVIDFALHGPGPAAAWAASAQPGQRLAVGGPRGSMVVPLDWDWHLFIGDSSAAPAIGRRLAELPAGARAFVVVQLDDVAVLELGASAAQVQLQQVDGDDTLLAAVRALALPAGEGYVWAAGEAGTMARMRDHLIGERGLPKEAMRVAAYWKRGTADHHEDL